MTSSPVIPLFLALFVGVLVVSNFLGGGSASVPRNLGSLDANWQELLDEAEVTLLAREGFSSTYTLNEIQSDSDLRVFVFDSRRSVGGATRWDGRCSFLAQSDTIACDVRVIDEFLSGMDWDKSIVPFEGDRPVDQEFELQQVDMEVLQESRRFFLIWILGHEIGHFVYRHGTSHFVSDPLHAPTQPRNVSQTQELEADSYLDEIFADGQENRDSFVLYLVGVLNTQVHMKACPGLSPLQSCSKIQVGAGIFYPDVDLLFDGSGTHPEFVIRAIRLIGLFDSRESLGGLGYLNRQMISRLREMH